MKVLVFCEYSGTVLDAFLAEGHDAYSADLFATESKHKDRHYEGDGLWLLREPWDLVIAHPPCSYLTGYTWSFRNQHRDRYGARWWSAFHQAAAFFAECLAANAPMVAVENPPIMHPPARSIFGPPDCWTDFRNFGGQYRKRVGFWLKNLPPLMAWGLNPFAQSLVRDDVSYALRSAPGRNENAPSRRGAIGYSDGGYKERSKKRSAFQPEMARAMAQQWGSLA